MKINFRKFPISDIERLQRLINNLEDGGINYTYQLIALTDSAATDPVYTHNIVSTNAAITGNLLEIELGTINSSIALNFSAEYTGKPYRVFCKQAAGIRGVAYILIQNPNGLSPILLEFADVTGVADIYYTEELYPIIDISGSCYRIDADAEFPLTGNAGSKNPLGVYEKLILPNFTPVNAVSASCVLTVANTPAEGDTVTIGTKTYKARLDALGVGAYASKLLSLNSIPLEDDEFTVGLNLYTITRTALDENTPSNTIYISDSGTSAAIDNIITAINTGYVAGVTGVGTVANSLVTATKTSTSSMTVTAKTIGFTGNSITVGESFDDVASVWFEGATSLSGGIDPEAANDIFCTTAETFIENLVAAVRDNGVPGTEYGTLTEANEDCIATKVTAATMKAESIIRGASGNSIDIAASGTDLSWADDSIVLVDGVDGTPGTENQVYFNSSTLYVCSATDLTIENNNWVSTILT